VERGFCRWLERRVVPCARVNVTHVWLWVDELTGEVSKNRADVAQRFAASYLRLGSHESASSGHMVLEPATEESVSTLICRWRRCRRSTCPPPTRTARSLTDPDDLRPHHVYQAILDAAANLTWRWKGHYCFYANILRISRHIPGGAAS
jgi:hypothetical protein